MPIEEQAAGYSKAFTTAGVDLPSFSGEEDAATLKWIHAAIEEGEQIIKEDPATPRMEELIGYVIGDQDTGRRPAYLSNIVLNHIKKSVKSHVSALTDIRPLFAYKVSNPNYQLHADMLNKLVVIWWVNTFADLELADALRYGLVVGTGDLVVEFDPHLGDFGDNRLIPKDPRDIIPIRPSRDRSIQSWEGVIIRETHSLNALKGMYPDKADLLAAEGRQGTRLSGVATRFRKMVSKVVPISTLDGLGKRTDQKRRSSEVTVHRTYVKDRSVNTTAEPITMGDPRSNWSYIVEPGQPLYPRKRLIVSTEHVVLYDGPSPYWHGMFPVVRLKPDPWPWLFLGLSLVHDLKDVQVGINKVVNDMMTNLGQHVDRGIIADKNAVPESTFNRLDIRKPNWKLRTNPVFGESVKIVDPPTLPANTLDFARLLIQEFDNLSGVANLQALLSLRQSPSADTIQKYWEALTPEIRLEGRQLEAALREVAEMVKVNIFQFYSQKRRMMLLGDAGITLDDFDYDPGNLIPAMEETDENYTPELDKSKPRDERARFFHRLFTFYVAPNSMLAMNAMDRKLMFVQLSRQGYMDFWTLMEMLEVPNVGVPPPVPLPTKDGSTQTVVNQETGLPETVPATEVRQPETITERLQAQAQLGIGMTQNPAGRKASGQQAPKLKQKKDASGLPRTTVSESG